MTVSSPSSSVAEVMLGDWVNGDIHCYQELRVFDVSRDFQVDATISLRFFTAETVEEPIVMLTCRKADMNDSIAWWWTVKTTRCRQHTCFQEAAGQLGISPSTLKQIICEHSQRCFERRR